MVEVDVMACIRMQIWHKGPGILVEFPCRLLKDTFAFAITDNVVLFPSDCEDWICEVACICDYVSTHIRYLWTAVLTIVPSVA